MRVIAPGRFQSIRGPQHPIRPSPLLGKRGEGVWELQFYCAQIIRLCFALSGSVEKWSASIFGARGLGLPAPCPFLRVAILNLRGGSLWAGWAGSPPAR